MYYMSWATDKTDAQELATALEEVGLEAYTSLPGMPEGAWIVEFGHQDWSDEQVLQVRKDVLEIRCAQGFPVSDGEEGPYADPQYKDDGIGCKGHQCGDVNHNPRTFYAVRAVFNEDESNLREEVKADPRSFPDVFLGWTPMCFDCIQDLYEMDNDARLTYWGSYCTLELKLWASFKAEEKQAILGVIKAREDENKVLADTFRQATGEGTALCSLCDKSLDERKDGTMVVDGKRYHTLCGQAVTQGV
jgi:hypothetical protein